MEMGFHFSLGAYLSSMALCFNDFTINIASWNCNGLKSSMSYLEQLASSHNITFIREHWIMPHEINAVKDHFNSIGRVAYLKSGMAPEFHVRGRPYGGTGFLCNPSKDYHLNLRSVNQIESVASVFTKMDIKCFVYMEFICLTIATPKIIWRNLWILLINLQRLLANCDNSVPIMIVGDMNTCLPRDQCIPQFWFKQRPYS